MLLTPPGSATGISIRWLIAAAACGLFVSGTVGALLGTSLLQRVPAGFPGIAVFAMLAFQPLLGPLIDRFGKKLAMIAGPAAAAASLWTASSTQTRGMAILALVMLGLGISTLGTAAVTLVADLYEDPKRKSSVLSLAGVFFGMGAGFLPLAIPGLTASLGTAPVLQGAAILTVAPALISAVLRFPEPRHPGRLPLARVVPHLRHPLVLAFGFLLFFESGNEWILGGLTATFLARELGLGTAAASSLQAIYWAALVLARLVLSRIFLHVRPGTVTRYGALCGVLGVGLLALAESDITAIPALVLAGLGAAGVFPTTLGLAGTRFAEYSGTLFGILFAIALAGGIALPWALAYLGAAYGLREALMLPVFGFLVIFFLQSFLDPALRAPRAVGSGLL
jgi:fucose permease